MSVQQYKTDYYGKQMLLTFFSGMEPFITQGLLSLPHHQLSKPGSSREHMRLKNGSGEQCKRTLTKPHQAKSVKKKRDCGNSVPLLPCNCNKYQNYFVQ